eukprot:4527921-Prymnesium_polylepis.1
MSDEDVEAATDKLEWPPLELALGGAAPSETSMAAVVERLRLLEAKQRDTQLLVDRQAAEIARLREEFDAP